MPETYVRPRATSWGSVFGGWLAALGSLAIFFPLGALGAGMSPAGQMRADDPALAFPLVLALFVSWLIGGVCFGPLARGRGRARPRPCPAPGPLWWGGLCPLRGRQSLRVP